MIRIVAGVLLLSSTLLAQQIPPLPKTMPGTIFMPHLQQGPISSVRPAYPDEARRHWVEQTVTLDAIIGEDGAVEQLGCDVLCNDSRPELVKSAAEAVRQWKWNPILVKGKAARVRTRVAVEFRPDEKTPPISVCDVAADRSINNKVVNVYGVVKMMDRSKLLTSPDCDGTLALLDNSELTPPAKDSKFAAFQAAAAAGPAKVAVRGLVRQDKSPGYHPLQQLVLERVLKNGE